MMNMKIISKGENMGAQGWLVWADRAYFGFAIIAAIATGLTIVAGIAQNRLNARISEQKDRDFKAYQIASANRAAAEANEATAKANLQIANLLRQDEPRSVKMDRDFSQDFEAVINTLGAFKGQHFSILLVLPDEEKISVAIDLRSFLKDSQWIDDQNGAFGASNLLAIGVEVVVNQNEPNSGVTWAAATVLAQLLYKYGFSKWNVPLPGQDNTPLGKISIIVAEKIPLIPGISGGD